MFSAIRRHAKVVNAIAVLALVFAISTGSLAAKKYVISSRPRSTPAF